LLYPPHALFLALDANVALHIVLAFNMVVGAAGMLLLLREMELGWPAALAGALVFELGDPMAQLTGWSPMQNASWAWVSWALFACERLLRVPSRAGMVGLAAALSLVVLPGWVLIGALTYQLIALRLVWEIITRRDAHVLRASGAIFAALALMPLLVAIQLVPAWELAGQSFRVGVEVSEFVKFGGMPLADLLSALTRRNPPVPFFVALLLLAGAAPLASTHRRLALFWLLTGLTYAVLALGPATPLYGLYLMLPPGPALVRYAQRLFWITGLSLAVLTAFAINGLTDSGARRQTLRLRVGVVVIIGTLLYLFVPGGLRRVETVAAAVIVVACLATLTPRLRAAAAWAILAAVLLNVTMISLRYSGTLLSSLDPYWFYQRPLVKLRSWHTAQDRALFHPSMGALINYNLMHKTASLIRVKEMYDYDALLVRRLVEYYSMFFHGKVLRGLDDLRAVRTTRTFRPRLLDVAAIRHVVTLPSMRMMGKGLKLRQLAVDDFELEVYENTRALPRARYVPRIEVVPDPISLLNRLADGSDDLATLAFVEAALPSGFTGEANSAAGGSAEFVLDDPEHLIIDVDAPDRGFLVVADAYYPGWRASVNGVDAPIERANYLFRLVEVPRGRSRVELRYRPTSVGVGAAISAAALVLAIAVLRSGRRPPRPGHPVAREAVGPHLES
jgi:hypothetical protein